MSSSAVPGINEELRFRPRDQRGGDLVDGDEFPGARAQVDEALVGERRLAVLDASALDQ
jgi:hypothetical protein